jgi:hypothetical protein
MMPKIKKFSGINNVAQFPELAGAGDLQDAVNVVITDDGSIFRRNGFSLIHSVSCSSLGVYGESLVYVSGSNLVMYHPLGAEAVVMTELAGSGRMRYTQLNNYTYFCNGVDNGVITPLGARRLGIAPPPPPVLGNTSGSIAPGPYQIALTYMRGDGQESGTSTTVSCECTGGGISVTGIEPSADTGVEWTAVYMTGLGGEVRGDGGGLKMVALLQRDETSVTLYNNKAAGLGAECRTFGTSPPPPSSQMFYYRGRMYYLSGSAVFYSLPNMFENVDMSSGFFVFPDSVKFGVPLEGGVWLGTDKEFMFLAFQDPTEKVDVRSKSPYGCSNFGDKVDSTLVRERALASGPTAVFVAECGVCYGDNNGAYINRTASKWKPHSVTDGCSVVSNTVSDPQYMFVVDGEEFSMNLSNGAITSSDRGHDSYAFANGVLYAISNDGVVVEAQLANYDTGAGGPAPVSSLVAKGGITFGSDMVKGITEVYIPMSTNGGHRLTIGSGVLGGEVTTEVPGPSFLTGFRGMKFDTARGTRGRSFDLSLENINGSWFWLSEINVTVSESRSRFGRQCHG